MAVSNASADAFAAGLLRWFENHATQGLFTTDCDLQIRTWNRWMATATGFGADGLTWGTVAARMIADLVQGNDSKASELLTPRRFTPGKSARTWATENTAVVKHLVGDRLSDAEVVRLDDIGAGEGRIVEIDGRKFAAHRSRSGTLSVVSPVCTHLGCHVAWNPEATSWDCPCHGSRFGVDGRVIEGPALRPLERYETD